MRSYIVRVRMLCMYVCVWKRVRVCVDKNLRLFFIATTHTDTQDCCSLVRSLLIIITVLVVVTVVVVWQSWSSRDGRRYRRRRLVSSNLYTETTFAVGCVWYIPLFSGAQQVLEPARINLNEGTAGAATGSPSRERQYITYNKCVCVCVFCLRVYMLWKKHWRKRIYNTTRTTENGLWYCDNIMNIFYSLWQEISSHPHFRCLYTHSPVSGSRNYIKEII